MRKLVFIAAGGILGSIFRYLLRSVQLISFNESFPLNTLIINITGSFLLAMVLALMLDVRGFSADIRIGITIGFLGAYTTFSTLCKEAVELLNNGDYIYFTSYLFFSAILGLGAAYLGVMTVRKSFDKTVEKNNQHKDKTNDSTEGEAE